MKVAALIVGLIGALLTFGLGAHWVSDFNHHRKMVDSMKELSVQLKAEKSAEMTAAVSKLERVKTAGYLMTVLGVLALVAVAFSWKQAKIAGAIMIAAAVMPALLVPKALAFTFVLLIGGGLALFARPKLA